MLPKTTLDKIFDGITTPDFSFHVLQILFDVSFSDAGGAPIPWPSCRWMKKAST